MYIFYTEYRGNGECFPNIFIVGDVDNAGSVGLKKSKEVLEWRPGTPALSLWSLEITRHAAVRVR